MDFTKFSDENFDLKNWINAVFVTQKDTNQNVEVRPFNFAYLCLRIHKMMIFFSRKQFVATLVTKLQVFIQVGLLLIFVYSNCFFLTLNITTIGNKQLYR